jgi:YD repeat-containing protein
MIYGYDSVGNVMTIDDTRPTNKDRSFDYDALDRLTTANANGLWGAGTLSYDDLGNRETRIFGGQTTSYGYDSTTLRLSTAGSQNFTYDANGNQTHDGTRQYSYTPANLVNTVTQGSTTTTYAYDGDDLRKRKIEPSGVNHYFVHGPGNQILSEFADPCAGQPSALIQDYVYAGNRLIAAVKPAPSAVTVKFALASSSVSETAGTAQVGVTLSGSASCAVTVNYATQDGTALAASDYVVKTGTLTFAPNTPNQTLNIQVPITNDAVYETTESFSIQLSGATGGASLVAPSTHTVSITNDDAAPTITINDVTIAEGNSGASNAVFTLSLSTVSAVTATVNYATADGSAVAGSDYTAVSGTLTFPAGSTAPQTITVPVLGDASYEGSEAFVVNLSLPSHATLARTQAVGTISNDDWPKVTITDSGEMEGIARFYVRLEYPIQESASVSYSTEDCTAVAPTDYTATSGNVTFEPGQTQKEVEIPAFQHGPSAPDKLFKVNLSNPVNSVVSGRPGQASIINFTLNPIVPPGDFNGDRRTDILWQNRDPNSGQLVIWQMLGFRQNGYLLTEPYSVLPLDWKIVGTPDLNADGNADIVWHYTGPTVGGVIRGSIGVWFMNQGVQSGSAAIPPVSGTSYPDPSTWQIVGTGDFNRDGQADLLWQYTGPSVSGLPTGSLLIWYLTGTNPPTPTSWALVQPSSGFPSPVIWKVNGVADVNGDTIPDLIWRSQENGSATGTIVVWIMDDVNAGTPDGAKQRTYNIAGPGTLADLNWQIAATYDMDRSGTVDLLWRNDSTGDIVVWFMAGAGPDGGQWDRICHAYIWPSPLVPTTWKIFGPK